MASLIKRQLIFMVLVTASLSILAQNTVPMGIHYQAVARDNYGNELVNKKISVKFSVISGDPLAAPVYQEVHQDITTSKFGVFSLVIGHGVPSLTQPCTSLSQIAWDQANHYLKVEVKFENDFMDMGTMQFLAVPYALYAQKSLEPGPEGPKGDKGEKGEPGDPATDNQTLSFDGSNLTISGASSTVNLTPLLQTLQVSNDGTGGYNLSLTRGNTINLATIEKDGDPANEIQDLTLNSNKLKITKNANATEWDLSPYLDNTDGQSLSWDPVNRILGISGSTKTISLRELESDADSSITNEIQDLQLVDNKLSITEKTGAKEVNMNTYLDNTDNQTLTFTEASNTLAVSGGNSVNLGVLRDNTDNQTLSFTETSNTLYSLA
ncbi:MAG: collagen-like protein [Bacteroidales bacterium]|nr:collagen-like protein [Bacteroidales bacterium]